jgi:DNA-binding NtrC family response regulator
LANAKDKTVTALKFLLADQDRRRAAAIGEALSRFRGVTVAGTAEELAEAATDRRVVLAADEPGAIERIIERIHETGIRAKVIAYSEEPSQHRMVKAMSAGAADYLHWPCDPAEIVAAANAATAEFSS